MLSGNLTLESQPTWNFKVTVGLTALVWLVFNIIGLLLVKALMASSAATDPAFDAHDFAEGVSENGSVLALVTVITAPLCIGLTVLMVWLRHGLPVREYLALNSVKLGVILRWLGILLLVMAGIEVLGQLSDKPVASDYVIKTYTSADVLPLFWLAVTLVGPVFEEVMFRGFMYKGIETSRLGVAGAILLTSLAWTAVHFQYAALELTIVFALGIVLGVARAKTQSLYVAIILHSTVNTMALVTASLYEGV